MKIPFKYTFRSFKSRKLTAIITVTGIALVVFVFAAALMMAYGVEKTLVSTGSPDNIKILRQSSQGEITSIIDGETQGIIRALPHIAKGSDGNLLISAEPVVIINLEIKGGGMSNVTVRGVSQSVYQLRPQIKLISGRLFNPSLRELIVGKSIDDKFEGAQIGSKVRFAGDEWKVVGIFEADGSGFESEMWGDSQQLLNAFNRGSAVSTVTLKLDDIANFEEFKRAFETDKRLKEFEPQIEQKYFEEQSEILATFIRVLGIFITVIFSFGATIGATITMYSAVANRTVEIGTMRSLGFSRRSILSAFLFEAILISSIGGVIGLFLASFLQFFSISTLNWNSFSELAFSFSLSPVIIFASMIFAIAMGILGGFFPSVRAARLNIVKALRAG
ncbi:MAG: ABC transporter permease [Ignavibacteriota bacterium]|nr:ABC transporter permease [Ignavibacteriota bacterium]MBW7843472.1 ABC transporter permease [Ignavibacterium sp.]MCO6449105.1 ABC transporter permease [Ignavibacterium album]MCZ2269406.1 ABC transporter permease [Ignavibacteriales bacterium]HMN16501.1 ABC transporter permease [Ignavibacteriaceae bacterium]